MEQVKVFTSGKGSDELEQQVNAWLEGNKGIEIIERCFAAAAGHNGLSGFVNFSVAIFYRDTINGSPRKRNQKPVPKDLNPGSFSHGD